MPCLKPISTFFLAGFLISCTLITGCTPIQPFKSPIPAQRMIEQAEKKNFTAKIVPTQHFNLATWQKLPAIHQTADQSIVIHIYLEGDGNSWKTKYVKSDNPTPKNPLALKLAMQDPTPYIVYIGRPCQYISKEQAKNCSNKYWTSHRYSKEVVQATNSVLDQIAIRYPNTQFKIIGFSGGGTIGALLSTLRDDIQAIITVAGNLDIERLGDFHQVSRLKGSLNPVNFANDLKLIPQIHWVGGQDRTVPNWLAQEYANKIQSDCIQVQIKQNFSHHKGWEKNWSELINHPLPCTTQYS